MCHITLLNTVLRMWEVWTSAIRRMWEAWTGNFGRDRAQDQVLALECTTAGKSVRAHSVAAGVPLSDSEVGGIQPPIRAVGCSLAPTVSVRSVCFYYLQLRCHQPG